MIFKITQYNPWCGIGQLGHTFMVVSSKS